MRRLRRKLTAGTATQYSTCRSCGQEIALLGGMWTDEDGITNCPGEVETVYSPHKPEKAG